MGRIAGKPWKMDKSEWLIDWENPEEVKKHSMEYYRRNRDRLSKLEKDRYGGEYGDIIRAIQREYYRANKDKKKDYQLRNKERRRRYRREYYLKHGK